MLTHLHKPTLMLCAVALLSACAAQPPSPTPTPATAPQPLPAATLPRPTPAPQPRGQNPPQPQGSDATQTLDFAIPPHPFDVILGRPTATSVDLSVLAYADQNITIAYGPASGGATSTLGTIAFTANMPRVVALTGLQPNTEYVYTINGADKNSFHTARPAGSAFTFTIQADSHLDSNASAQVYVQTLANQRADHPDFVIDMGDTFMTDKYKQYTDAAPQYLAQRYFFGQLANTAPLFLTLGNHDGEGAPRGKNGAEMSAWSAKQRNFYFPNPAPNAFYTGNTSANPGVDELRDYYAWTWGDALFIVLDPYWYTPATNNTTDFWNPTLGKAQYLWLKSTLEASSAKWKFVFIHQLVGGLDKDGRGGVEVAAYHEWGGRNPDGAYAFDAQRPGWGMPIHQLLVAHHVSAVFHGHDHLFVHQELDGIVYQEIPQPASARPNSTASAAEYGYRSGVLLGGPGHLRVSVDPSQVKVEYVRSYLAKDEKPNQRNAQVDYSYQIITN